MSTHAIIQARLGSSRLPAKILLALPNGKLVIQEVIDRVRLIDGIDDIVLAIPVADYMHISPHIPTDIQIVTGDEDDVLLRYIQAARYVEAQHIMRITADCPLLNPSVSGEVLELYHQGTAEIGSCYAANCWPERTYPQGWDTEVFSRGWLELAGAAANSMSDREHVTPFIQREARRESKALLLRSTEDLSGVRITLDTINDYRTIRELITKAGECAGSRGETIGSGFLASLQATARADA